MDKESKKLIARKIVTDEAWPYVDKSLFGKHLAPIPYVAQWKYNHVHEFVSGVEILQQQNEIPKEWTKEITKEQGTRTDTSVYDKPKYKQLKDIGIGKKILDTDFKVQRLISGDISGYPSPSEARLALLNCLVAYGLSDVQIHSIMELSRGLHWHLKKHLHQREINLARSYVTRKRELY